MKKHYLIQLLLQVIITIKNKIIKGIRKSRKKPYEKLLFYKQNNLKLLKRCIAFITCWAHLFSSCALVANPSVSILAEELSTSTVVMAPARKMALVIPTMPAVDEATHNIFGEVEAIKAGIVFKAHPRAHTIYNRIYSDHPTDIAGTIESDSASHMVMASTGGLKINNADFRNMSHLSMIAGGIAQTDKGPAYGVDKGQIHLCKTVVKTEDDVKNLTFAGHSIAFQQSILAPEDKLKLTFGSHIRNLATSHLTSVRAPQDPKPMLMIDEHSILQSKSITIEGTQMGVLRSKGLLQSTGDDIIIRTAGDVYIDQLLCAGNLSIITDGKVVLGKQAWIKGKAKIKARDIHIAHHMSSGGNMSLKATNLLQANGAITSQGKLKIQGQEGVRIKAAVAAKNKVLLESTKEIFQEDSLLAQGEVSINGGTFVKRGHIISNQNLNIKVQDNVVLELGELLSLKGTTLTSVRGTILNQSRILSDGQISLMASAINNFGEIETSQTLKTNNLLTNFFLGKIKAKSIDNITSILQNNRGTVEIKDSLRFTGDITNLKGIIKTQGTVEAQGNDLILEGSLSAEQGLKLNLKKFENNGNLTVAGEGVHGFVDEFINRGDIEFAGANVKLNRSHNHGILRTKGHFLLEGTSFHNKDKGLVFTGGVHQLNLQETYSDEGFLYTPTLLLLKGKNLYFRPSHRSHIREGVLESTSQVTADKGAGFHLQSKWKCSLQVVSKGNIDFNSKVTSNSLSYPFSDYFIGGEEYQRRTNSHPRMDSPALDIDVAKELTSLPLAPWEEIRRKLGTGIHFTAEKDITYQGETQLESTSVFFSAVGNLVFPRGKVQAGYFSGNDVSLQSINTYLNQTQIHTHAGSVSFESKDNLQLNRSQVHGGYTVAGSANRISINNSQLSSSGIGSASSVRKTPKLFILSEFFATPLDARTTKVVMDSQQITVQDIKKESKSFVSSSFVSPNNQVPVNHSLSPYSKPQNSLAATKSVQANKKASTFVPQSSTHQVPSSSSSKTESKAGTVNLVGQDSLSLTNNSKLTGVKGNNLRSAGNVTITNSAWKGQQNSIQAKRLDTSNTRSTGTTNVQVQQMVMRNHTGGTLNVTVQDKAKFEGNNQFEGVDVNGRKITNKGEINASKSVRLSGSTVKNQKTIKAGQDVTIESTHAYKDYITSLIQAGGVVRLKAENNDGFKGNIKAAKAELHLHDMDLRRLTSQVDARLTEAHFKTDVVVNEDLVLKNALHLWANRLENKAKITANGDFLAHMQKDILNVGSIQVNGSGSFFAEEEFTNKGELTTAQHLIVKAKSIYNNSLMRAQGRSQLEGTNALTNMGTMQGEQGLSAKTDGKFTTKGILDGGEGLLSVEAHSLEADAEVEDYQYEDSSEPHVKVVTKGQRVKAAKFFGKNMSLNIKTDISAKGAQIDIKEDASITAGGHIDLNAVAYQGEQQETTFDLGIVKGIAKTDPRQKYQATNIKVGNNLTIRTPGTLTGHGIQAIAGGNNHIQADRGIDIRSLASVYVAERKTWHTGLFNQNRHERVREDVDFYQSSIQSSSGSVFLGAIEGGINAQGAGFSAAGEIGLHARHKIDLSPVKVLTQTYEYDEDKFLCFGSSDEKHIKEEQAQVMGAVSNKQIVVSSSQGKVEGEGIVIKAPKAIFHGEKGVNLSALEKTREETHTHRNTMPYVTENSVGVSHHENRTRRSHTQQTANTILANELEVSTGKGAEATMCANVTGFTQGQQTKLTTDTDKLTLIGLKHTQETKSNSWSVSLGLSVNLIPEGSVSVGHDNSSKTTYEATVQNFGILHNKRAGGELLVRGGAQTRIQQVTGQQLKVTQDNDALNHESQDGRSVSAGVSSRGVSGGYSQKSGEKVTQDTTTSCIIATPGNFTQQTIDHSNEVKDTRTGFGFNISSDKKNGMTVGFHVQQGDQRFGATIPANNTAIERANPANAIKDFEATRPESYSRVASAASSTVNTLEDAGIKTGNVRNAANILERGASMVSQGEQIYRRTGSLLKNGSVSRQTAEQVVNTAGDTNRLLRRAGVDTGAAGQFIDNANATVRTVNNLERVGQGFSNHLRKPPESNNTQAEQPQSSGSSQTATKPVTPKTTPKGTTVTLNDGSSGASDLQPSLTEEERPASNRRNTQRKPFTAGARHNPTSTKNIGVQQSQSTTEDEILQAETNSKSEKTFANNSTNKANKGKAQRKLASEDINLEPSKKNNEDLSLEDKKSFKSKKPRTAFAKGVDRAAQAINQVGEVTETISDAVDALSNKEKAKQALAKAGSKEEFVARKVHELEEQAKAQGKPWGSKEKEETEKNAKFIYGATQIVAAGGSAPEEFIREVKNKYQELRSTLIEPIVTPLMNTIGEKTGNVLASAAKILGEDEETQEKAKQVGQQFADAVGPSILSNVGKKIIGVQKGNSSQKKKTHSEVYKDKYPTSIIKEDKPIPSHSFESARNKSIEAIGEIDPQTREFKRNNIGVGIGFRTRVKGTEKSWRIDYDKKNGPHINVNLGTGEPGSKKVFTFPGEEEDVSKFSKRVEKDNKHRMQVPTQH